MWGFLLRGKIIYHKKPIFYPSQIDFSVWMRYHECMVSRIIFVGVCVGGMAALGSLVFFLLLVNPEYLGFSGFLLFYCSLFVALWSSFFIAGDRFFQRRRGTRGYVLTRRSALAAFVATGSATLAQMSFFSGYTLLALLGVALAAEYWFARR